MKGVRGRYSTTERGVRGVRAVGFAAGWSREETNNACSLTWPSAIVSSCAACRDPVSIFSGRAVEMDYFLC